MAENQNDNNVELIDDEVITLFDEENNPVDFNVVAVIEYQSEFYALLQPVEQLEGFGEDEAVIFKIVEKDEETDEFEPVTDESVLEAVFNEYLKAEAEFADECDCGCHHHEHGDCCGDGCDCHHDHDRCCCDRDCGCGEE